jgi:hypothetical protein
MRRAATFIAVALLVTTAFGCAHGGPGRLRSGHVLYNQALNTISNEQLLLNLVRLRYRDTPTYLQVSSISSQYTFSGSAGVSADFDRHEGLTDYGGSFGIGYTEKPTISFSPLQGDKFVNQILSPIPLDTVALLFHSGWNVERVFRCAIQGMNALDNAPNASSPTPSTAPEYERFKRATELLRALQVRGQLEFAVGQAGDDRLLLLRVAPEAAGSAEMIELAEMLGLPGGRTEYEMVASVLSGGPGQVGIDMRSLIGVLYFISQAVEVPPQHEAAGLVTVTRRPDGTRFDWSDAIGELLRVRWSEGEPAAAAVKVNYRGTWFYIADDDLESKSTFTLLSQMVALQAGGLPTTAPVLTIPIG